MNKYICFDTETTGLSANDEILSLAIVNQDNEVLFYELFKPLNITRWDEAERIHGISPDDVKDKKSILEFKNEIINIFNDYDCVIGYNVNYDIMMILNNLNINICNNHNIIDVMKIFAEIYGEWNSYRNSYRWQKLSTCADYYGYEFKAHNALEDVKATIYCYKQMLLNC